jgi:hypothetical protein
LPAWTKGTQYTQWDQWQRAIEVPDSIPSLPGHSIKWNSTLSAVLLSTFLSVEHCRKLCRNNRSNK